MKQSLLFIALLTCILLAGCKDEDGKYPDSAMPEIVVERDALYSVPNRKFVIKANLKDDLGLKTLRIQIPEFYLDKEISFKAETLITEYALAYEFLAPAGTTESEKYKVMLTLTDVSDNSVTKELTLNLDGDFNAPALSNITPSDGTVMFATHDMTLNIAFDVTDATGIDSVMVSVPSLGIDEKIEVGGGREYAFDKSYPIPADLLSYQISITTLDNFVEPNRATRIINFTVADGLTEMFLADVPRGTDLTADVFGVPMLYHKNENGIFTFRYYADSDNKEIYFLGQETSFAPHCFGASSDGGLENGDTAQPIVLPTRGYYEIVVDPSALTYTATPYSPSSPVHNPARITICGNGMELGGWDPDNTDLLLTADADNPYRLQRTLVLTGGDVAMTITSPGWGSPWWRLEANAIVVFLGGGNHNYSGAEGTYQFVMDTELERAFLVKE